MTKKISRIHQRVMNKLKLPKGLAKAIVSRQYAPDEPIDETKKRVTFMSQEVAQQHRYDPEKDVLISIGDCDVPELRFFHPPKEVLTVRFNDSIERHQEGLGYRLMGREDGKKIVEFVLKHENAQNIIVHCKYGQSRSKGVALAIAEATKRTVLYANSMGRLRRYREADDDGYYNRRAYELVLMASMEHDMELPTA